MLEQLASSAPLPLACRIAMNTVTLVKESKSCCSVWCSCINSTNMMCYRLAQATIVVEAVWIKVDQNLLGLKVVTLLRVHRCVRSLQDAGRVLANSHCESSVTVQSTCRKLRIVHPTQRRARSARNWPSERTRILGVSELETPCMN